MSSHTQTEVNEVDEKKNESLSKKARLWVVTELYYPEETSTGYYLTRIAEGLADTFATKVICGQPNYSARGTIAPRHETRSDVEIFRVFSTTLDKNVIPFRIVNMITLNVAVLLKGLARFRTGDQILVVTTPPLLPFAAAVATLARGGRYTLLIHDSYPELLIASKKVTESGLFARTLNFFNRWLYKHAAKIIVVGRDMERLMETKTSNLEVPLAVIQNWAELETVRPLPKSENRLLIELGLEDKFVLLYAGNMGHPNDLETIISCAEKLRDEKHFHFLFLGSGVKDAWLRSVKKEKGLENVTILSPRPRSEQLEFLNACDIAIVSLVQKMLGVSMPSRTYNILAAGKPILALTENGSELAKVIEEENVGWIVPPGKPETLLHVVREIYDTPNDIEAMKLNARKAALDRYSLAVAIEKYRNELSR